MASPGVAASPGPPRRRRSSRNVSIPTHRHVVTRASKLHDVTRDCDLPQQPSNNTPGGLRRSNSTGTLFVDSTISQPNRDDTLACVALALHYIIVDGHAQEEPLLLSEKFDEKRFPLTANPIPADYNTRIPSDSEIFTFMDRLFEAATLSAECGIITLVYINRCIQCVHL